MRVLGLTGGIGSGKSTVARIFIEMGAEVVDADSLAREVVQPGQPALQEVVASFGAEVLLPDGRLDRAALARIVFADAQARSRLNAITHPKIRSRMQEEVDARGRRQGLLLLDIPLLFENPRLQVIESVILVWVDPGTQLQRLIERDRLTPAEARSRIQAQMPLDEKRSLADAVIDNSGSLEQTREQVVSLYRRYADPGRA